MATYDNELEDDKISQPEAQGHNGFELVYTNLRNKQKLCIKYGNRTQSLPEELAQNSDLQIVGNCLATDNDTFELQYINGEIVIGCLGTAAVNPGENSQADVLGEGSFNTIDGSGLVNETQNQVSEQKNNVVAEINAACKGEDSLTSETYQDFAEFECDNFVRVEKNELKREICSTLAKHEQRFSSAPIRNDNLVYKDEVIKSSESKEADRYGKSENKENAESVSENIDCSSVPKARSLQTTVMEERGYDKSLHLSLNPAVDRKRFEKLNSEPVKHHSLCIGSLSTSPANKPIIDTIGDKKERADTRLKNSSQDKTDERTDTRLKKSSQDKIDERTDTRPKNSSQDKTGERADTRQKNSSQDKTGERADTRPKNSSHDKTGERADTRPKNSSHDKTGERADTRPKNSSHDKTGERADTRPKNSSHDKTSERADTRQKNSSHDKTSERADTRQKNSSQDKTDERTDTRLKNSSHDKTGERADTRQKNSSQDKTDERTDTRLKNSSHDKTGERADTRQKNSSQDKTDERTDTRLKNSSQEPQSSKDYSPEKKTFKNESQSSRLKESSNGKEDSVDSMLTMKDSGVDGKKETENVDIEPVEVSGEMKMNNSLNVINVGESTDNNEEPKRPPRRKDLRRSNSKGGTDVYSVGSSNIQLTVSDDEKPIRKPIQMEEFESSHKLGYTQEFEMCIKLKYFDKQEFNENASLTCNLETFMKWNYALNNPKVFDRSIQKLIKQEIDGIQTECVEGEMWLVIDIGTVSDKIRKSQISNLRDKVKNEFLHESDDLFVNSFAPRGLNFAEISKLMMEKSVMEVNHELWVYTNNTEYIHYVCHKNRKNDVEATIKKVIDLLKDIQQKIEYHMVFKQVFDHEDIKQDIKQKFRKRVTIALDCIESENICRVTLNGPKYLVQETEKWLQQEYISKFSFCEISFKDIKNLDDHSVESLVKEILFQLGQENVFWVVNDICRIICICSCEAQISKKVTASLKNCLKKKKMQFKMHDIIWEIEEVKKARVIVRELKDIDEVEIIGLEKDIDQILLKMDGTKKEMARKQGFERKDSIESVEKESNNQIMRKMPSGKIEEGGGKGLKQKIPVPIKNSVTFKTLCTSAELKIFCYEHDVELEAMCGSNGGFLLRGLHTECLAVKVQITRMIDEQEAVEQSDCRSCNWSLRNGHQIIVKSSKYLQSGIQHTVLVHEVPPEQANYDKKFKLSLPQLADGFKKKEEMGLCVKELLTYCWDEKLFTLKLEIPKLHKKSSKQFAVELFEQLNTIETERNPPFKMYLCTDSKAVYEELTDNCDNCLLKLMASVPLKDHVPEQRKEEAKPLGILKQSFIQSRRDEQEFVEPRDQSIERGEKVHKSHDQMEMYADHKMLNDQEREWREHNAEFLKQPKSCECYVLVRCEEDQLEQIHIRDLENILPLGVTIIKPSKPQNTVLLKCRSQDEAKKLITETIMIPGVSLKVEELPIQSLYDFNFVSKNTLGIDQTELQNAGISFDKANSIMTAPTVYQLNYVQPSLGCGDINRERSESVGFDSLVPCSQEIWEIIHISRAKNLENLYKDGIKCSYDNGNFTASNVKPDDTPDLQVIWSSIQMLQKMDIIEVELDKKVKKSTEEITGFCKSIEKEQGKECIVFISKRYSVMIFYESYENAQKLKHQILVWDGQVKVRARRGHRYLLDSDGPVTDVITKAVSLPGKHQSDNYPKTISEDKPFSEIKGNQLKRWKKPEFSLNNQARNLQEYTTDEGIKVLVYEANILKLPVACIVNAANDSLQHGGGVARVIAQAAGRALDTEGFEYIRKYGKVPVGKACVTTAGKLHYECVIHTVGPCWHDYKPHSLSDVQDCERDLYSAIKESLQAAETKGLESIALPAISAAIFAVPVYICVYQYAIATLDYSRDRSSTVLKEIHFIDINPNIISSIQKMFTTLLRDRGDPHYSSEKYVKQRKTSMSDNYATHSYSNRFDQREKNSDREEEDKSRTITISRDKCVVNITCEDIMQVKTSAIVSSEDLQGSGKGYIAKQIAKKISDRDRTDFERRKQTFFGINTKPGDVYVSSLLHSEYSYILHAVIPYETRNSSKREKRKTIKAAFRNIFIQLDEINIESVVTGLLGAGSDLQEDVQIAAQAFIQAFNSYCEKTTRPERLLITLVCKTQTVYSQVIKIFEERGLHKKDTPPPRPPPPAISNVNHESKQQSTDQPISIETCAICMESITDRKELKCGHAFDTDCIQHAFEYNKKCPTCGTVCGEITGNQPEGKMTVSRQSYTNCAGYESCGRITITYDFPGGRQKDNHPNPGKWYSGVTRIAYLPDNADGREILEMLRIAFKRKLTFTIGSSRTTGQDGVITWNDIHHKTNTAPYTQFGYPDPTYLTRVKEELAAKGITPDQIPR